jgi:hypothetical protein
MDFIIRKQLSRRTVLKGAGAAIALPFLDAMSPTRFSRFGLGAPAATHRFQCLYVPNGMAMEYWTPEGEGTNFELSPILEPLAPFRDQMLVLTGIDASWNNIHAGASGSFLTGCTKGGRNNTENLADVSIDQLLAREWEKETQVGSLEVSMDKPANAGVCSGSLNCSYTHTVSWRTKTQPLPMESNPRAVFERLFGDSGSTDREPRARRLQQQSSILDSVMEKLGMLERELGAQDNLKMQEYSEALRDVERRIQIAEQQIDIELPDFDAPQGAPAKYEEHAQLMLDLQFLALQADLTRVITFMYGKEQSSRPYPMVGVAEGHHPLSHHNQVPDKIALMSKINRYHVDLTSRYMQRLKETPDGDGSMLDHITILYGCGISNSSGHSGKSLPLMLLGGGNGRIKGGRHVKYANAPIMSNLLVTIMDKLDVPVDHVGGSTGALPVDVETLSEI